MSEYHVAGDGDGNYHVPNELLPPIVKAGGAQITMTLTEVISAPPGFDIYLQEEATEVKVETEFGPNLFTHGMILSSGRPAAASWRGYTLLGLGATAPRRYRRVVLAGGE